MSLPRQGRYKPAGERTPKKAENHAATVSALLFHAYALTLTQQRHKTLTHNTIRHINQASGQRPTVHTPHTRQRLLSVTSLKPDTRIRSNKPNHRLVTTTITKLRRRTKSDPANLSPRALTTTHRPNTRNCALHERDTPMQGTNLATISQALHDTAGRNRLNHSSVLLHATTAAHMLHNTARAVMHQPRAALTRTLARRRRRSGRTNKPNHTLIIAHNRVLHHSIHTPTHVLH